MIFLNIPGWVNVVGVSESDVENERGDWHKGRSNCRLLQSLCKLQKKLSCLPNFQVWMLRKNGDAFTFSNLDALGRMKQEPIDINYYFGTAESEQFPFHESARFNWHIPYDFLWWFLAETVPKIWPKHLCSVGKKVQLRFILYLHRFFSEKDVGSAAQRNQGYTTTRTSIFHD